MEPFGNIHDLNFPMAQFNPVTFWSLYLCE